MTDRDIIDNTINKRLILDVSVVCMCVCMREREKEEETACVI